MNIIVTGAAGFIGSHTVDRLLVEGHDVVGLDNLRTGRLENLQGAFQSPKFRLKKMDITGRGWLADVVGKVKPQAMIHLAALVSVQESIANPELNHLLNVEATQLVAEAAAAHRVPRIVFASSAAVYGDCADERLQETSGKNPLSPYGSAKLKSEDILFECARQNNLAAVCFRYFNVYGRRQDPASPYSGVISIFRKQFSSGQPVTIYGDGEQTRDFVHVSDVARANVLAATIPGAASVVANICTGQTTSLNRLVEIFRGCFPEAPSPKYAAERPGDIRHSCGDPSLARTRFGFSAKIPIQEGLLEFAAEPAICAAVN
jgi:UDP-glucose 4-epimerase